MAPRHAGSKRSPPVDRFYRNRDGLVPGCLPGDEQRPVLATIAGCWYLTLIASLSGMNGLSGNVAAWSSAQWASLSGRGLCGNPKPRGLGASSQRCLMPSPVCFTQRG